jgi:superfamily I DNA and/or RNA helicase
MWLDVPTAESGAGSGSGSVGHWVPAEGEQARKVISALLSRYGVSPKEIFVLSPFRDVATGIERIRREFRGVRGGTVHTAQGKEADVVVLILGGHPRMPRAKEWASERPNLLNVAVSRARRRLYVIGDRATWSRYPFFDALDDHLP